MTRLSLVVAVILGCGIAGWIVGSAAEMATADLALDLLIGSLLGLLSPFVYRLMDKAPSPRDPLDPLPAFALIAAGTAVVVAKVPDFAPMMLAAAGSAVAAILLWSRRDPTR